MSTSSLARTRRLVASLAIIGLLLGGLAGFFTLRTERFVAQATLAMLPGPDVPPQEALGFWEVLNRGQATRTAALTLQDPRWLGVMSESTGVLASDFALSAGAIPDTTLIEVSVQAGSAWAAERGLGTVLADGVDYAERVSGPFALEPVSVEYNRANSMSPGLVQQVGVFALAGLLVGAGAGFLISRSGGAGRGRSRARRQMQPDEEHEQKGSSPQDAVLDSESSGADKAREPSWPERAR